MTAASLPGVLAEIAEIAGEAAALAVAGAKGGRRAYIPAAGNLTRDHWLVEAVGLDAARKIAMRLGGGEVPIPLGPAGSRARIWHIIREGIEAGLTAPEIAARVGVDEKTVRRHRNGHSGVRRTDPRQRDLFQPPDTCPG